MKLLPALLTVVLVFAVSLPVGTATPPSKPFGTISPHLIKWFRDGNKKYFEGKLPEDTVVQYGILEDALGETGRYDGIFYITVDPRWAPAEITQLETLLHESCHIETWPELARHGPQFYACIRRLREADAFDRML